MIKEKIRKLNLSTQEILDILLSDTIMEMNYRNRINEDILERIVLVYLSLFDDKEYLEYDELKASEKNIICRIILKGIASIYVDDEYMYRDIKVEKSRIIYELMIFLCFLTNLNYSTIKRLTIREIKIYARTGWDWDFL